jgi:hypothetical protein
MYIEQKQILESIDIEIEDREMTDYDTSMELKDLRRLRKKVENKESLEYEDYEWISYMIYNNLEREEV